MTEEKPINEKNIEIYEEFPFPKFIQVVDYFFPKTKDYKPIDWHSKLKVWASWAPWVGFALLIGIAFFIKLEPEHGIRGISKLACLFLFISSVKFFYALGAAFVAKCLKRSSVIILSFAPIPALCFFVILCAIKLLNCAANSIIALEKNSLKEKANVQYVQNEKGTETSPTRDRK